MVIFIYTKGGKKMKKIGIIMIIISAFLICASVFLLTNNTAIKTSEFQIYGGEFRKNVSIKSRDIKSRMKITLPSVDETGFSCNGGSDFNVGCDSKYVSLSADSNDKFGSYLDRGKSLYNSFKENDNVKYIKELECLENSYCYIVKFYRNGKDPTNGEYFDLLIQGASEKEHFEIRYNFVNGNAIDYVDEILKNIKITYDATYTVGKVNNNKLNIRLKGDTNEKEIYSYIDLVLDSNKYHEIEDGNNSNRKTIVKTNNSSNIKLYYSFDSNPYEGQKERYFSGIENTSYILYYPIDDNSKYEIKEINDNVTLIYDKAQNIYNIRHSNRSVLTVVFENKKDSYLINDFYNITAVRNEYSKK